MRTRLAGILVAAAPVLAMAAGAAQAGTGYKCDYDTQTCLNHMASELKNRGWIGIDMDIDEEHGVWTLKKIVPGSPAEAAGMKQGDILMSVNGQKFGPNMNPFEKVRSEMLPGKKLDFVLVRKGKEVPAKVTLAEYPPDIRAQIIGMHMLEHVQAAEVAKKEP